MNAKLAKILRKEVKESLGVSYRHETKYRGIWRESNFTQIVDPTCARGIYRALKKYPKAAFKAEGVVATE